MNDVQFCARLSTAAASVDGSRWQLAELAAECKAADFPLWAERIGSHPLVRRKPRTIYEWAQTAETRALFQVDGAPFDFYRRALRYLDKLEPADIRHMLETAVADGSDSEQLSGALSGLLPEPTAPALDALLDRAVVLLDRAAGIDLAHTLTRLWAWRDGAVGR